MGIPRRPSSLPHCRPVQASPARVASNSGSSSSACAPKKTCRACSRVLWRSMVSVVRWCEGCAFSYQLKAPNGDCASQIAPLFEARILACSRSIQDPCSHASSPMEIGTDRDRRRGFERSRDASEATDVVNLPGEDYRSPWRLTPRALPSFGQGASTSPRAKRGSNLRAALGATCHRILRSRIKPVE